MSKIGRQNRNPHPPKFTIYNYEYTYVKFYLDKKGLKRFVAHNFSNKHF